jgi:hypothetical protein
MWLSFKYWTPHVSFRLKPEATGRALKAGSHQRFKDLRSRLQAEGREGRLYNHAD